MKNSVAAYSVVAILSLLLFTGFTCSKHSPEKSLEPATEANKDSASVPQDQLTDQTSSGDSTTVTH